MINGLEKEKFISMKQIKLILGLATTLLVFSNCSASKKTSSDNKKAETNFPVANEESSTSETISMPGDCATKWGKGEDSMENIVLYTLWHEDYKIKEYESAYENWEKFLERAPGARLSPFQEGEVMLKAMLDKAFTQEKFDKLMSVYEKRIECWGDEGYVRGRKGLAIAKYTPDNVPAINTELGKSMDLRGNETFYSVLKTYFATQYKLNKEGSVSDDDMFALYDKISAICETNIGNGSKYASKYADVQTLMDGNMGTFVRDCSDVIEFKGKDYQENPNDITIITKFYNDLKRGGCKSDPLYQELLRKKHSMAPDVNSTKELLNQALASDDYNTSISYYEQLITLDAANKGDYLYKIAYYLRKQGSFSNARAKAQEAIAARPGWGKPYILIGDMYASSSKSCTGDKIGGKSVFWAAVDVYSKAKSDPETASDAQSRINKYSAYFPTKEEMFFNPALSEGASFNVGCWIGVSTRARSK